MGSLPKEPYTRGGNDAAAIISNVEPGLSANSTSASALFRRKQILTLVNILTRGLRLNLSSKDPSPHGYVSLALCEVEHPPRQHRVQHW